MGLVYLKKNYTSVEYLAVAFLVLGLFLFSIGDASVSPSFNVLGENTHSIDSNSDEFDLSLLKLGILLSSGDAFSDALKSSMQENLMALYAASTLEVVNYPFVV